MKDTPIKVIIRVRVRVIRHSFIITVEILYRCLFVADALSVSTISVPLFGKLASSNYIHVHILKDVQIIANCSLNHIFCQQFS